MARRKLTKNQIEYNKQVRRIKNFIKRAEKRGYEFNEDILPKTPKRITKQAIKRLENLKPNQLYAKAEFLDTSTGEMLKGTKGRKLERQRASEKAKQTRQRNKSKKKKPKTTLKAEDVILNNFYEYLKTFPVKLTARISQFVKKLEKEIGRNEVATALQNMPMKFHEILAMVNYSSDQADALFCTQLLEYLPNASEQYKKDAMEQFEYYEVGFDEEEYD